MPERLENSIGQQWRIKRRLWFDNPPSDKTICTIWGMTRRVYYLECEGYSFSATREQLQEYFEEVTPC